MDNSGEKRGAPLSKKDGNKKKDEDEGEGKGKDGICFQKVGALHFLGILELPTSNKIVGRIMLFLAWKLKILVVAGKSRRSSMAPAHFMVFLSQKPGTEDGI